MVSSVRGGSTVYLEPSANQDIQKTLCDVPQPAVSRDEDEIKVEWEIDNFVWWSEFLKKLPKRYLKLLKMFDIPEEDYHAEFSGFHRYYHTHQTNCVESIFTPVVSAGRLHPYCSVKHRRRASCRSFDRLKFLKRECSKRHVRFDYIIKVCLTFPMWVSYEWGNKDVQLRIREAVKDFLKILYSELYPTHHSKFGVIANHHFWSSQNPLASYRHIHLTLPNIVYNSKSDMFFRIQPKIKSDVLRKCWRKALEKNALWGVDSDTNPVVWIGYVKFSDRDKVMHRLSYCCRKPIEDMVREADSLNLSDIDKDFVEFLLSYTPRRINLGYMCNLRRFGYSRKSIGFRCPICGEKMQPELNKKGDKRLYPRPPPGVRHLFRNKKGDWCEMPDVVRRCADEGGN